MGRYFNGRINRATYFLCFAVIICIFAVIIAIGKRAAVSEFLFILIGVPRLHDFGRSGWWMAGVIGLEIAVVALGLLLLPMTLFGIAAGLATIAVLATMIAIGCIKGDEGTNDYGEASPPGISFSSARA